MSEARTWMCLTCGWIHSEVDGDPAQGIATGTAWADVAVDRTCPASGARRGDFEMVRI